jgi:hypothetical protein
MILGEPGEIQAAGHELLETGRGRALQLPPVRELSHVAEHGDAMAGEREKVSLDC